jgi:hypothetical protein
MTQDTSRNPQSKRGRHKKKAAGFSGSFFQRAKAFSLSFYITSTRKEEKRLTRFKAASQLFSKAAFLTYS